MCICMCDCVCASDSCIYKSHAGGVYVCAAARVKPFIHS